MPRSFAPTGKKLKLHVEPLPERVGRANALSAFLVIIEVILCGEIQRYAHRAVKLMQESGLYKHEVKRQTNELRRLTDMLQKRCSEMDMTTLTQHITDNFPAYRRPYLDEGGGVVVRLQSIFLNRGNDIVNRFYLSNKQMVDKAKLPHSELCASLLTITAMASTGIEAYDKISSEQNKLLFGDIVLHRSKSTHHERILATCQRLMEAIADPTSLRERSSAELAQSREFLRQMRETLSGQSLSDTTEHAFTAVVLEFVEYALACFCIDLHRNTVPDGAEQFLAEKMGSTEDVERLKQELLAIPLPDDVDAWDFAHELPEGGVGSALSKYRHICACRHDLPSTDQKSVNLDCNNL